jgi:hypothetical protein
VLNVPGSHLSDSYGEEMLKFYANKNKSFIKPEESLFVQESVPLETNLVQFNPRAEWYESHIKLKSPVTGPVWPRGFQEV